MRKTEKEQQNEVTLKDQHRTKTISNCLDCPFHKEFMDPDPDDWFNDDDMRVYCTKAKQNVTSACRPYNLEVESYIPDWCPLLTPKTN